MGCWEFSFFKKLQKGRKLNEKKLKMDYIGVLSSTPHSPAYRSTFKYFNKYLITLGEPTASANWTMLHILKHARNIIIKEKVPGQDAELMIDSGGFQIIVGKIRQERILEFIECYHKVLELYPNEIDKIFSLDINNFNMTTKDIYDWNKRSTEMTIESMKKFPQLKSKVLFVLQNRNERVFEIWRKLFVENRVWEHFDLYSFGGLVGLKKATKVNFNHAVPATMWLLTYAKKYNFEIKQLHWLGQSSRVVFIAMALLEKLYGIYLTSDSSEIIRFAPIAQKLPLLKKEVHYNEDTEKYHNDFDFARTPIEVLDMLDFHSWDDDHCPRASRDILKSLDIDRDILHIIPQSLLDLIIHANGADKLDDENKKKLYHTIVKTLYRVMNDETLDSNDLDIIKFKTDENSLKFYNSVCKLSVEEIQNSNLIEAEINYKENVIKLYDYLQNIKTFGYKNRRSLISKEIFQREKLKRLDNCDYIELMCQNIESAMIVADMITDRILEIGLENCNLENLKECHITMAQGKTAKTTLENIQYILKYKECVELGDTDTADNYFRTMVQSYPSTI